LARSYHQISSRFDDAAYDEPVTTPRKQRRNPADEVFRCTHCRRLVCPLPQGGKHRNHCPFCLHSRHVDAQIGDRMSTCGASMAPIAAFQRPDGEHALIHRCLGCGFERFNRIAADDDFTLVLALPVALPRTSRHMKRAALLDATEATNAAADLAAE
jgi:hypothetical protein